MPAPAAPELPQVRIKSADLTTYLDYVWGNDLGGDLLKTANCGPLRNGASTGGRWDLSIVPGSISSGPKTCTIRRKVRNVANALLEESSHPDHDTTVSGVLLDGVTGYDWLVPGWQTVFNDLAVGIVDTHTAHITEGDFIGSYADGNPDAPTPGSAVYTRRCAVVNEGSDIAKNVYVRVNRNKLMYRLRAGAGGLDRARVTNTSSTPKIVSGVIKPYKYVWADNGTTPALKDLTEDGLIISSLIRLLNNSTVDSHALQPGERYRINVGNTSGIEFSVSAGVAAADRFNLILWPPDPTEASADNSGTAVGFSDVDILIGDLAPAEVDYFWVRVFANIGSGDWNPILCGVGIDYLKTGVAAIDED